MSSVLSCFSDLFCQYLTQINVSLHFCLRHLSCKHVLGCCHHTLCIYTTKGELLISSTSDDNTLKHVAIGCFATEVMNNYSVKNSKSLFVVHAYRLSLRKLICYFNTSSSLPQLQTCCHHSLCTLQKVNCYFNKLVMTTS